MGLVLRVEKPWGCGLLAGFKARLFFGDPVLNEKDSVVPLKQPVAQFHNYPRGYCGYRAWSESRYGILNTHCIPSAFQGKSQAIFQELLLGVQLSPVV
jgi:hypothetical protein